MCDAPDKKDTVKCFWMKDDIENSQGTIHQEDSTELESTRGSHLSVVGQVFPAFLVAGVGMVAAGLLLGKVHRWPVFIEVREILILVPALLGLKGNLEMTLASRLSTHANLGHLDPGKGMLKSIVIGNLTVVQCQAVVVGLLAALVAVVMNFCATGEFSAAHCLLLSSCSVSAASTASLLLASIMIIIVLASHRNGINPDNVASPIAGMLGDFCTLALIAGTSHLLWRSRDHLWWLQIAVILGYTWLGAACARIAVANKHVCIILQQGWTPVIISMLISSAGGLILKQAVHRFRLLAPFAPVMNGAGAILLLCRHHGWPRTSMLMASLVKVWITRSPASPVRRGMRLQLLLLKIPILKRQGPSCR